MRRSKFFYNRYCALNVLSRYLASPGRATNGLPLLSTDWDIPPTCVVNCGRPQVISAIVDLFVQLECSINAFLQVLITNIGGSLVRNHAINAFQYSHDPQFRYSRPSEVTPDILYDTITYPYQLSRHIFQTARLY